MVMPFLAIYINKHLGVTMSKAGLVLMVYGFGSLVTAPLAGQLADRLGNLRVMKLSLFINSLVIYLYSFISNFELVLLVTIIWAVINEAFRPANLAYISIETPPSQRKTAFALNRLMINLGMSIGPVIGGFLSQINYSLLFYVNGTSSLLAGVFLSAVKFNESSQGSEQNLKHRNNELQSPKRKTKNFLSAFKDRKLVFYMVSLLPVSIVFFQFLGGLPLYIVKELQYSEATFGILMAVNTVLIIILEVPLNDAMSHWDERKALALGSLLAAIGFGAMAFSGNIIFLVITIIIWTFGEMMFFPSGASYTSIISPEDSRGEYMGYYQMTFSLSLMVGPWLGAFVLENFGPTFLWSSTFFVGLISTFMFVMMIKRNEK